MLKSGTDYVIRLVILASIAFALAAILSPRADAQHEHFEPRGAPHFEPHGGPHFEPRGAPHFEPHGGPHFEPHMRFDDHFHHDHFYPALGFAIATLPLGYYTVHDFDRDYYFHAGVWYRHVGPYCRCCRRITRPCGSAPRRTTTRTASTTPRRPAVLRWCSRPPAPRSRRRRRRPPRRLPPATGTTATPQRTITRTSSSARRAGAACRLRRRIPAEHFSQGAQR